MQSELHRPFAEVVWYQTEQLEENPDTENLARLQASLAYLLTQQPGLVQKMPHKALNASDATMLARLDAVRTSVAEGVFAPPKLATPLPTAIALWPVDSDKKPVGTVPEGSGWVGKSSPKFVFRDRTGELEIGYFETTEKRPPATPPILSIFDQPPPTPSNPKRGLGSFCTIVGFVLFLLAMGGSTETGGVIADAHRIVVSADSDVDARFEGRIAEYCKGPKAICDGQTAAQILEVCTPQIAPSAPDDDGLQLTRLCSVVWDQALIAADDLRSSGTLDTLSGGIIKVLTFLSRSGTSMAQSDIVSVVPFYLVSMIGLVMVFAGLGFWTSGRGTGIAINTHNRLSLSLAQITAWSIVILSAYATYCAFNVGAVGAVYQQVDPPPNTTPPSLFPQLEAWTWAVMGIVIASPALSALIKGAKPSDFEEAEAQEQVTSPLNLKLGPLSRNVSPSQASFLDIFLGEDKANDDRLDISRAQNVIITALLLFTFNGWLLHLMGGITMSTVLEAFVTAEPILSRFPEPGATFTALLALTHATYLAGKWKPTT